MANTFRTHCILFSSRESRPAPASHQMCLLHRAAVCVKWDQQFHSFKTELSPINHTLQHFHIRPLPSRSGGDVALHGKQQKTVEKMQFYCTTEQYILCGNLYIHIFLFFYNGALKFCSGSRGFLFLYFISDYYVVAFFFPGYLVDCTEEGILPGTVLVNIYTFVFYFPLKIIKRN